MAWSVAFGHAYYNGGSTTTSVVPSLFDIALNGRPYMLDTKHEAFKNGFRTVPIARQQADDSEEAGSGALSREFVWRRDGETWDEGAGQKYWDRTGVGVRTPYDRAASSRLRFWDSMGVDPWTQNELSLLPECELKQASVETNLRCVPAGSRLYFAGATSSGDIRFVTDITPASPTFTAITTSGGQIYDMCSDGFTIYTAHGTAGIHTTTTAVVSSAAYVTGNTVTVVAYLKGRLMAASTNKLWNFTAATSGAATPLLTHANSGFTWTCFGEGPGNIYAGGYSGDKSIIYRTAIKADGTALDVPQVCGELPDGEIIRSMKGYLSFLVIGTNTGFRLAHLDSNGNIDALGNRVVTDNPVLCFEPQERFVWYGLNDISNEFVGLGRMDLTQSNAGGTYVPGYARDLQAPSITASSDVLDVCTFQDQRVFAISGKGFYSTESSGNLVSSGWLDSGLIGFGVQEKKIGVDVDIRHLPLEGEIAVEISENGGDFNAVGSSVESESSSPSTAFALSTNAELMSLKFTLTRDSSDHTVGPTLTKWSLRAYPVINRSRNATLPILLHSTVYNAQGAEYFYDTDTEFQILESLALTQDVVTFQELSRTVTVAVVDLQFERADNPPDKNWWNGTCVVLVNFIRN